MELEQTHKANGHFSFKPEKEASIQPAIAELERLYDALVLGRFPSLIDHPRPRILIQWKGRKRAVGWFSANRWREKDNPEHHTHEITLTAEDLTRGTDAICETLTHETVHLRCYVGGLRDVGVDGRYHNRTFQREAEAVGLIVEKAPGVGFGVTTLSVDLKTFFSSLNANSEVFEIFRVSSAK